jgi:hypothetical protein
MVRMTDDTARLVERAESPRDALRRLVAGYPKRTAIDRHLYLYVTAGGASSDMTVIARRWPKHDSTTGKGPPDRDGAGCPAERGSRSGVAGFQHELCS